MEKCNMWMREMMWKKLNNVNEGKSRRNCNQQIKKREQVKSWGREREWVVLPTKKIFVLNEIICMQNIEVFPFELHLCGWFPKDFSSGGLRRNQTRKRWVKTS